VTPTYDPADTPWVPSHVFRGEFFSRTEFRLLQWAYKDIGFSPQEWAELGERYLALGERMASGPLKEARMTLR
jgi:hypothetical protein